MIKRRLFKPATITASGTKQKFIWQAVLVMVILSAGAGFTWMISRNEDERMREEKLIQVRMLAKTINWEIVQTLTGSEADLESAGYRQLKNQLSMLCAVNPYCRFLYLMGQRQDGMIFFLVDSEPPDSKDYSPPGQVYYEASDDVRRVFTSEREVIVGPTTDRWGTWINALIPKTIQHNEKSVTVVAGMDIDIRNWRKEIASRSLVPVLITLLLEALVIFVFVLQWRTERAKQRIAESEARLAGSESKYRSVVENIQDVFYRVNADNIITMASPSAARLFGYDSTDELIGKDPAVLWADPDKCDAMRNELKGAGRVREWEIEARRRDGALLILAATLHLIRDEQGNPAGYEGICHDITDRRRAEEALHESTARLHMALEGTKAGLWDWNVQTGQTVFNERWAEIVGYSLKELEPTSIQTWIDRCHPEDLEKSNKLLEKHFSRESEYYDCEVRMKHKEGTWIWVHDRGKVVEWDQNGNPVRMIGTHIDISKRKNSEAEREMLLYELKNAFENIKTLRGLLPICASCKKVRNDKGYWEQIEIYIEERSDAEFSHGLCPECAKKLYPEFYDQDGNRKE